MSRLVQKQAGSSVGRGEQASNVGRGKQASNVGRGKQASTEAGAKHEQVGRHIPRVRQARN